MIKTGVALQRACTTLSRCGSRHVQGYIRFTDAAEEALSTQRHIDRFAAPVVLAFGTQETPEFQRQSRDFNTALRAASKPVELLVGQNYNHFELVETLGIALRAAGRAALAQIAAR